MKLLTILLYSIGTYVSFMMMYKDSKKSKNIGSFEYTIMVFISFFSWLSFFALLIGKGINEIAGKNNDDFLHD